MDKCICIVLFPCSAVSRVCDPMDCSMPGFPVLRCLLEFAQTHVHLFGEAIQPSHPLSAPPPVLNLSQHQVFSNESFLWIRWPKYWSFNFSISPSSEHSGLISFRIGWFDLAVQGNIKNSLAFSLLYGPILTFIHNYWKNHKFDYVDLCWQSDVFAF